MRSSSTLGQRRDRGYSGINELILWGPVVQHGFRYQSWLTFRQALPAPAHFSESRINL